VNRGIGRIVILGGGPVAWLAAAALARAFRHRKLEVIVVDSGPSRDAPIGRWTLPSQRGMHALIGIREVDFMRRTGATFKLASEHVGWQGDGRFLHAHGDIGSDLGETPFYKYLLIQRLAGRSEKCEDYSVAAVAARLGRFARPMGEENALTSSFTYAFHIDEAAYVTYLREHVVASGATRIEGHLADISLSDSGAVTALLLTGGQTISGDYFLDCSGPDAAIMSRLSSTERQDWSAALPCDRMWSAKAPPIAEPAAVTQTTAMEAGWSWRAPLANAQMVGHVYSSAYLDDDAALAQLHRAAPEMGEPLQNEFTSGRRSKFWDRNCIALGSAAVELEPLAGGDLHLAQLGIATLIELFPLDARSTVEADEYNRVMGEHADGLRDFTLAHYRAARAPAGDFWSALRAAAMPARLSEKLELYGASGRINLVDFESFEEVDWAWLLMGAGYLPDAIELQIRSRLERVTAEEVAPLRTYVERIAASMPRHIDFVQRQGSQAPHAAKS
jgi:tryptophan halogenase